ncbi:MAG: hypothetical protein QNK15_11770 [Cycloclasticus sp.]|nr:hypothetical protein [Cycloclasticus sp.]
MKNGKRSSVSYFELRTTKGNGIVIHDKRIKTRQVGRICLYNAERDAIVQYDEAIVSTKLFPINGEQAELLASQFQDAFKVARKQYIGEHGKPRHLLNDKKQSSEIDALLLIEDEDENDNEIADDSFNDDNGDDD